MSKINPTTLSDDHYAMMLTCNDYLRAKHPDYQGKDEWGPITPEQEAMTKAVDQFKRRLKAGLVGGIANGKANR